MIPASSFENQAVGVFGLARSGISVAAALQTGGAHVYAWDDMPASRAGAAGEVKAWRQWPWDQIKALVLSPGVPLTHPRPHEIVDHARSLGVEVIGDMELFAREIRLDRTKPGRAPVIAITGTNG